MAAAKDLSGKRFGKLLVVELNPEPYISPTGNKTRRWNCLCDCGNRVTVLQNQLTATRNPTRSCGCSRLAINQPRASDLTGQRFGRLLVLGRAPLEKPEASGVKTGWLVRCDCGTEKVVPRRRLEDSGVLSCGCLLAEKSGERVSDSVGHFAHTTISAIRPDRGANKNSKSGIRGVYWSNSEKCYIARIGVQGRSIYIGRFSNLEDAAKARRKAEEKYFAPLIERYEQAKKSDE